MRSRDQIKGTVKLCFQQAEEVGGGSREILAELKKHEVASVFGIHLVREQVHEAIRRVARGTAETFRCEIDVTVIRGVSACINDPHCSAIAAAAVTDLVGESGLINYNMLMPTENFGDYLADYPGVFAFVGTMPCRISPSPHAPGRVLSRA